MTEAKLHTFWKAKEPLQSHKGALDQKEGWIALSAIRGIPHDEIRLDVTFSWVKESHGGRWVGWIYRDPEILKAIQLGVPELQSYIHINRYEDEKGKQREGMIRSIILQRITPDQYKDYRDRLTKALKRKGAGILITLDAIQITEV